MLKAQILVEKVKANLIIQHCEDDALIEDCVNAAISYAEQYQHKREGFYSRKRGKVQAATEQAVIMLASFFYESRDGGTGGYFANSATASQQSMTTVNALLRLDRNWKV